MAQYKDRKSNKYDRNKFDKKEIGFIRKQKDDKYDQMILILLYNGVRISELLEKRMFIWKQYFVLI